VYSEVIPASRARDAMEDPAAKGIILSGSYRSVRSESRDWSILKEAKKPVLGICYGHQLIAHVLGGEVQEGVGEYGRVECRIARRTKLLAGVRRRTVVWMSHRDHVTRTPDGFTVDACTRSCKVAAMSCEKLQIYGVQFHPEVHHTREGGKILKNFLFRVCKCSGGWKPEDTIDHRVRQVKLTVGGERALCAVSGGVDSTTAALIARRAIGDNLRCILIDHGLMRKGERESILKSLSSLLGGIKVVEAQSRFLGRLKGVADPEEKRRVIGEEYAKVLQEAADEEGCSFLIQGTIYPDRVESGRGQASEASRIKTHHNVGGLPSWLKLKVVEPLADLYKDEVRKIAAKIGVPSEIIWRHPFPGPGLAVRVIGEVTPEKLHVCREASHIVEEELKKAKLYRKVWQAFAVVGDDKATGVKGDKRALGYIVTVRVVTSVDGMTADWAKLPHSLLDRISSRITGEIQQVTWVTYAITTKPPATIEPV